MVSPLRERLPLIVGAILSVVVHGAVVLPAVATAMGSTGTTEAGSQEAPKEAPRFERQADEPAPEERPNPLRQPVEHDRVTLGIDDGTDKPTVTWIGYDQYQEHLARLSEVEQAAFRMTPEGGGEPAESPTGPVSQPSNQVAQSTPPTPPPTVAQPSATADSGQQQAQRAPAPPLTVSPSGAPSPTPPERTAPSDAPPPEEVRPAAQPPVPPPSATQPPAAPQPPAPDAAPLPPAPPPETPPAPEPEVRPANGDGPPRPDTPPPPEAPQKPQDPPVPEGPPAPPPPPVPPSPEQDPEKPPAPGELQPTPTQPAQPPQPTPSPVPPAPDAVPANPNPAPSAPPAPPPAPASAPAPAAGSGLPNRPSATPGPPASGEQSDRESDATSLMDVPADKWQNGKPLAAKGLQLQTRRPDLLPEYLAIQIAPGRNPVFELHFDRDGKVRKVELIQDSGAPAIDDRLMDCLYRWRAKGDRLKTLKPDDRLKLKMRLLVR